MRGNSRFRRTVYFVILFALAEIDHSRFVCKGDSKGQPELVQPLDNHPLRLQDAEISLAALERYQEILMHRINELLSEALDLLGRAKDTSSRQWIEVFIYKIGELALDLEGLEHDERKIAFPTRAPPSSTTVLPSSTPPAKNVKMLPKYPPTSSRFTDVLPPNESAAKSHVVTTPGFTANFPVEDELVRQLHEAENVRRQEVKAKAEAKAKLEKQLKPLHAVVNPSSSSDRNGHSGNIRQSNLQDLEYKGQGNTRSKAGAHINAGAAVSRPVPYEKQDPKNDEEFEVVEDVPKAEIADYYPYHPTEANEFSYFPSTAAPLLKQKAMNAVFFHESGQQAATRLQPANKEAQKNAPMQKGMHQNFPCPYWLFPYPFTKQSQSKNGASGKHANKQHKQPFNPMVPESEASISTDKSDVHKLKQQQVYAVIPDAHLIPHTMQTGLDMYRYPFSQPQPATQQRHIPATNLNEHGGQMSHEHQLPNRPYFQRGYEMVDLRAYNQTMVQIPPYARLPDGTQPNANDMKLPPSIPYSSHYPAYANIPFKQAPLPGMKHLSDPAMHKQIDALQRQPVSKTVGTVAAEQLSFPSHLESNPELQYDMERQLRAGKVVILSDSLVKTNFGKQPPKTASEHAPLRESEGGQSSAERQN